MVGVAHRAGLLADLAGDLAAGHGRPGALHQDGSLAARGLDRRWSHHSADLRVPQRRRRKPAGLLDLPALLPLYALLCLLRLQNSNIEILLYEVFLFENISAIFFNIGRIKRLFPD